MSATQTKLRWADAVGQANAFHALFAGCFVRWEVAGSIRRRRPEVGDVEHVVIPALVDAADTFWGDGRQINLVRKRLDYLIEDGTLSLATYTDKNGRQSHRNGDKYIGVDYQCVRHELFMASPENFGCILAIRTGSADFARALVTRMHARGYRQKDGRLWRVDRRLQSADYSLQPPDCWQPLDCSDETIFFGAAGLNVRDWPPEKREGEPR